MQNLSKLAVKQLEKLLTKDGWLERLIAKNSKVGDSVFFEKEQFPWSKDLEANWMVIRKELEGVLERVDELPNFQDISKRQSRIANDNRWKTYFFYAFGFKATKNCERCPETTKLIEQIPGMKVAFFSILAPGKHIPKHRGKLKTMIRYHLGLIVPKPEENCKIQIADEIRYWEEGESLIFDDTFYHEVWNNTDGYRVVLFLDIARPLKFPLSFISDLANKFITATPIVQEAKASHKTWEDKFEANNNKSKELVS